MFIVLCSCCLVCVFLDVRGHCCVCFSCVLVFLCVCLGVSGFINVCVVCYVCLRVCVPPMSGVLLSVCVFLCVLCSVVGVLLGFALFSGCASRVFVFLGLCVSWQCVCIAVWVPWCSCVLVCVFLGFRVS